MIGVSFYPFYGSQATVANLKSTLTGLANTFGKVSFFFFCNIYILADLLFEKDIIVAETDWPAAGSCPGVTLSERSIPLSASGQTTWLNDIKGVLNGLPGGHGVGFIYWEPGWIGNAGLGSSCSVSVSLVFVFVFLDC